MEDDHAMAAKPALWSQSRHALYAASGMPSGTEIAAKMDAIMGSVRQMRRFSRAVYKKKKEERLGECPSVVFADPSLCFPHRGHNVCLVLKVLGWQLLR